MELEGTVKKIGETQTFGTNGFRKRELVITTTEQYPQDILIEFVQDKVDLLNNYKVGGAAKVSINIRGREWINPQGEEKYFNSIQGWRIEALEGNIEKAAAAINEAIPPVEGDNSNDGDHDDLPF